MNLKRLSAMVFVMAAVCFSVAWAQPPVVYPDAEVMRFDMGAADSAVMKGFVRVTGEDVYSEEKGYGWVGEGYESVLTEAPTAPQAHWFYQEKDHYASLANDMTRDEVKNVGDMTFRVGLPDGKYRVILYLGDLRQPLGSMQVYANGELVRKNVQAKHWRSRQGGEISYGNSFPVRFTVKAEGKALEVGVKGDDSDYKRWVEEDSKKPPMESFLAGKGGSKYNRDLEKYQKGEPLDPRSDLGHPFVYNAIQGIEIYPVLKVRPYAPPPPGILAAWPPLREKEKRLEKDSEEAIREYGELPDPATRMLGWLRILGSPMYDVPGGDQELIEKIEPLMEELAAKHPDDYEIVEAKMTFDLFQDAVFKIENRSRIGNPYHNCLNAQTQLEKLQPDDALYYKGLVYRARALYMIDPHQWAQCSGTGKKVLEELEKKYPENRYVQLYLHDGWPETEDWKLNDYREDVGEAPEWAIAVQEGNNLVLDLAEWWIINKQQADGSLGGGWGDDVELVGFFGLCAKVSEGISDMSTAGAKKLISNAWIMSEIDTEAGYFAGVADAQHTAEFTGDTIPVIMMLDPGNPVWIERAMKTGKLLRDLWTAKNAHGYRSFRSNYLGATAVGSGKTAASSAICLRAIEPIHSLYEYNQNPVLGKLLVELADGWLDAAMDTGKEKPKGIMPATFSFPEVEMGGPDSPSWYDTGEMPWRQFFIWPKYRGYVVKLLRLAYDATGDEKYLEPFKLAREYLAGLEGVEANREALPGSPEWMKAHLENHQGIAYIREMESKEEIDLAKATGDKERILEQCDRLREGMRQRWPIVTTESLATDRVHVPGMIAPVLILTSADGSMGTWLQVTYENTGRDFAAYVPVAEPEALKVVIFLFYDDARVIGFRPWELEIGGKYEVRAGPDADGDDVMDAVEERGEVTMAAKGQPVYVTVPGRQTYVVEVELKEKGAGAKLLPDLAVTEDDIEHITRPGILNARVHSVGAVVVEGALVRFYDGDPKSGGEEIGEAWIPRIAAPNDFDPQTLKVGITWRPTEAEHEIYVVVDPEGEVAEISEANNAAHRRMSFEAAE